MKPSIRNILILFTFFLVLDACATYRAHEVEPTSISQAQHEIPEEDLLDVGISVFESKELTEESAKEQGTHSAIRKAEQHFVPYHLKNTLQQSSHWGAVRVIPAETAGMDILVRGEIMESNGEHLIVKVEVIDASGTTWLQRTYEAKGKQSAYSGNVPGQKDAFQDLYNTIANDLAASKKDLTSDEIRKIRSISRLKFAEEFAPDAFHGYLTKDEDNLMTIHRLPADDDPMMDRLLKIRERDHMYVDTLNEYYDNFYNEMWPAYENWRKANLTEQAALRKVKKDAFLRQAAGALMLALAIALDVGDVPNTGALQNIMILAGGAVIVDGINISQQAEIHSLAIQELSDSFGAEMQPVVMEFQGKKYELSGSAEEQYARWRELLREIYYTETGFSPDEGENIAQ
jgi:hypothetical protein